MHPTAAQSELRLGLAAKIALLCQAVPRSLWVLADQGVVSLTNFAVGVTVGRIAGETELGVFGLGFSLMMVLYAIAKSFVWTPYTTRFPQLAPQRQATYTGSVTAHLLAMCGVASVVMLLLCGGASVLTIATGALAGIGLMFACLAVYMPAILLREHVRRLCLAKLSVIETLLFDVAVSIAQLSVLYLLVRLEVLSGATAFLALAACSVAIAGWYVWRGKGIVFSSRRLQSDWLRNWPFSKWLASAAVVLQVGNQGTRWALSIMHGLAAIGRLTSAQMLIMIANPIVLGVSNYFGPASATLYAEQGLLALWKHTVRSTWLLLGFVTLATGALVGFGPDLARLIFADKVSAVSSLLVASLALGVFSEVVHIPVEFASLARQKGRLLFNCCLLRFVANITIGFVLIWFYGPLGVGFGMLIGNLGSLAWQWKDLAAEVHALPGSTPVEISAEVRHA